MKTSHMIPLSFQPFGVLIPFGLPRRSVEKKHINGLMTNDDHPPMCHRCRKPQKNWKNILLPSGKRLHNYGKPPFFNSYVSLPEGIF